MTFEYLHLEVQQMLQDDEVFMCRMTELKLLKHKLQEQKNFYTTLEDQLNRAREVQMIIQTLLNNMEEQIQQQLKEVLAMHTDLLLKNVEKDTLTKTEVILSDDEDRGEEPSNPRSTEMQSIQPETSTRRGKVRLNTYADSSELKARIGRIRTGVVTRSEDEIATDAASLVDISNVSKCDIQYPKLILNRLKASVAPIVDESFDLSSRIPCELDFDCQKDLTGPADELHSMKNQIRTQQKLKQMLLHNSVAEVEHREVEQVSTKSDKSDECDSLLEPIQKSIGKSIVTQLDDEVVLDITANQRPMFSYEDSEQSEVSLLMEMQARPNRKRKSDWERKGKICDLYPKNAPTVRKQSKTYICKECFHSSRVRIYNLIAVKPSFVS